MKTVAFVPIKLNNERVPGKNTKPLNDGTPLMTLIQRTLLKAQTVDEMGVYEKIEDIDHLRFLENKKKLHLAEVRSESISVDTKSDLEKVRKIIEQRGT